MNAFILYDIMTPADTCFGLFKLVLMRDLLCQRVMSHCGFAILLKTPSSLALTSPPNPEKPGEAEGDHDSLHSLSWISCTADANWFIFQTLCLYFSVIFSHIHAHLPCGEAGQLPSAACTQSHCSGWWMVVLGEQLCLVEHSCSMCFTLCAAP